VKKTARLIAFVIAFVIGGKLLIENVLGFDLERMAAAWIGGAGPGVAVVIAGLLAADIVLPVPSSLVMVLSGAAFGTLPGAAVALAGSIGGEWLGFELVRRYGRRMSAALVGEQEVERLDGFFRQYGAAAIIITRPLPIVMETMSVVAGLSTMSRLTFLTSSLLGTAPIALVYAYAGAKSREVGNVLPAAVMLVALSAGGWLLYRVRLKDRLTRTRLQEPDTNTNL
jgi:uncharacterized membrane protein YdjX (TVP38/TMEM64 family)